MHFSDGGKFENSISIAFGKIFFCCLLNVAAVVGSNVRWLAKKVKVKEKEGITTTPRSTQFETDSLSSALVSFFFEDRVTTAVISHASLNERRRLRPSVGSIHMAKKLLWEKNALLCFSDRVEFTKTASSHKKKLWIWGEDLIAATEWRKKERNIACSPAQYTCSGRKNFKQL